MSRPLSAHYLCALCGAEARGTRVRLEAAGWFAFKGECPEARHVCPGCKRERKGEVKQMWEEACRGVVRGLEGEGE